MDKEYDVVYLRQIINDSSISVPASNQLTGTFNERKIDYHLIIMKVMLMQHLNFFSFSYSHIQLDVTTNSKPYVGTEKASKHWDYAIWLLSSSDAI